MSYREYDGINNCAGACCGYASLGDYQVGRMAPAVRGATQGYQIVPEYGPSDNRGYESLTHGDASGCGYFDMTGAYGGPNNCATSTRKRYCGEPPKHHAHKHHAAHPNPAHHHSAKHHPAHLHPAHPAHHPEGFRIEHSGPGR
jgi:hypothetical protein